MTRPWHTWSAFGLASLVVLGALAWTSVTVLRLDRAETHARRQAQLEENVRLALWRMDSALAPLVTRESARPHFVYSPFYSAERAYTRRFAELTSQGNVVPSPLLVDAPEQVLIHFQYDGRGRLTSPQVPTGAMRHRAGTRVQGPAARTFKERLEHITNAFPHAMLRARLGGTHALKVVSPAPLPAVSPPPGRLAKSSALQQKLRSKKEFEARAQNYAQQTSVVRQQRPANALVHGATIGPFAEVRRSVMQPLWFDDMLILARRTTIDGEVYLQGCWLDWTALQAQLLDSVRNLLPRARLTPTSASAPTEEERRLAALPVRLVAGPSPDDDTAGLSPLKLSLLAAWVCVLLAAVSVAALLRGVLALSERRRVFVSAVTHELRTPLTTFRMYTDMLAGDMLPTEAKRRDYLTRLRDEAERLGHLVENVLFYARLDNGRGKAAVERVDLKSFLLRALERVRERAERAGLRVEFDADSAPEATVRADASAVEQILVNLVDNACKYAREGAIVKLLLTRGDRHAVLEVQDQGPGLSDRDRRRLFRPFSKSDREAAASAPGVGLGLALSRRLARALGGDLHLNDAHKHGAAFLLTLPLDD